MIRMEDYEQSNWSVGRSYLSMGSWEGDPATYRHGLFRSEHGLVEVFESVTDRLPITSLRFIHEGRDYVRRWSRNWSDKTIARLCRELIEDVVG